MQALSDETRLRCFRLLAEAKVPLSSPELVDVLDRPLYAVSRAMSGLAAAGLVKETRKGRIVFHALTDHPGVSSLAAWSREFCLCPKGPGLSNSDGSSPPGRDACAYDLERLNWRLRLRENDRVVVTYDGREKDPRKNVLFVCVHNSARSQLAEEYLRLLSRGEFAVESAGLTPGSLNPQVVEVLREEGIDISQKVPQAVSDLWRRGKTYDWVITVCSREAEKDCPVFPGPVRRLNWPFADPSTFRGSPDEIKDQVRNLAGEIKNTIYGFLEEQKGA